MHLHGTEFQLQLIRSVVFRAIVLSSIALQISICCIEFLHEINVFTLKSSTGDDSSESDSARVLYGKRVAANAQRNSALIHRGTKSGWLWYKNSKNCINVTGYSCVQLDSSSTTTCVK